MTKVLVPPPPTLPNPIHPWLEDREFLALYRSIQGRTLVDGLRCYMLVQLARHVRAVPGHIAEIGVYQGGTARLLAATRTPGKALHLFDTFAGMPECDPERDQHGRGDFADTSLEGVRAFLGPAEDVCFHAGRFPETAAPVETLRFSFVHVDCDIHRSVLDCCRFFHPRMERGGVLLFDDYGFVSCPGAKRAVDEYFATQLERPIYLPTGQCFVIKL